MNTKKIIVSGCANCPYLTVWNNGEGKGINGIVHGSCNHPSWNRELLSPVFDSEVFFQYEAENVDGERVDFSDVSRLKPDQTPQWCPLPDNKN